MGANVKKWVIAVAIAIVFNLFINYGVATFYEGPEYNDYCNDSNREPFPKPLAAQERECQPVEVSDELREVCSERKGYVAYNYNSTGCPTSAYCETCSAEHQAARDRYDANVFAVLLIAAVAALAAGVIIKADAVSTGFLLAGVLGLVIAAARYWGNLQDIYRFALLGIVLAILVWLGYKKAK